ncbi:MAG: GntR family transcriptional regulator [Tabrizicola sp.]|nr:GntR family transcriptional regulator [Tabrizicola sp.]
MKQPRLHLVKTLAEPIGKKAVSELVVQRILDLVKSGHLSAGDKLPSERDLAEQLDVSRPTVREALRALSILGVLEIRHGASISNPCWPGWPPNA